MAANTMHDANERRIERLPFCVRTHVSPGIAKSPNSLAIATLPNDSADKLQALTYQLQGTPCHLGSLGALISTAPTAHVSFMRLILIKASSGAY